MPSNRYPESFDKIIAFIREAYGQGTIPLHEPRLGGHEKDFVTACIDSTFVSSTGKFVERFERMLADYTGSPYAVATVNGTAALHLSLLLAGVRQGDEVLTQAASFIATANAVAYCRAHPVFLDCDRETAGMSHGALGSFLEKETYRGADGQLYNRASRRRIAACVPMHVFGHPVRIDLIGELCDLYRIPLVEDAAEALGSFFNKRHAGTFGVLGIISFNGNKIVTTGGGGVILTGDETLGTKARHWSTTAKTPHPWSYFHDHLGFNYRMPNINAALGCAQMGDLSRFLASKREMAARYQAFFQTLEIPFLAEPPGCRSNYWLNAILLADRQERDAFLSFAHQRGVMCRPLWTLLSDIPMYSSCQTDGLVNARFFEERLVNLPSSVRL